MSFLPRWSSCIGCGAGQWDRVQSWRSAKGEAMVRGQNWADRADSGVNEWRNIPSGWVRARSRRDGREAAGCVAESGGGIPHCRTKAGAAAPHQEQ
eukprot:scaffold176183_cov27-Tisochrysis_lutea.AAC.2